LCFSDNDLPHMIGIIGGRGWMGNRNGFLIPSSFF
jgi:hypothetical protein